MTFENSPEILCSMFTALNATNRVKAMVGMFDSCTFFEMRFFSAYLEDANKSSPEICVTQCNFHDFIQSSPYGLTDPDIRKLLIMAVVSLSVKNSVSSYAIYRYIVKNLNGQTWRDIMSDVDAVSETLLLLTLVVTHPAFTFEQRAKFFKSVEKLQAKENNAQKSFTANTSTDSSTSECTTDLNRNTNAQVNVIDKSVLHIVQPISDAEQQQKSQGPIKQGKIKSLELLGLGKKRTYKIEIMWSSGKKSEVLKTSKELIEFHQQLLQLYPKEQLCGSPEPQDKSATGHKSRLAQSSIIRDYLRRFMFQVAVDIRDDDFVTRFFQSSVNSRQPPVLVGTGPTQSSLKTSMLPNANMGNSASAMKPDSGDVKLKSKSKLSCNNFRSFSLSRVLNINEFIPGVPHHVRQLNNHANLLSQTRRYISTSTDHLPPKENCKSDIKSTCPPRMVCDKFRYSKETVSEHPGTVKNELTPVVRSRVPFLETEQNQNNKESKNSSNGEPTGQLSSDRSFKDVNKSEPCMPSTAISSSTESVPTLQHTKTDPLITNSSARNDSTETKSKENPVPPFCYQKGNSKAKGKSNGYYRYSKAPFASPYVTQWNSNTFPWPNNDNFQNAFSDSSVSSNYSSRSHNPQGYRKLKNGGFRMPDL